ncbi:MAG TPA: DUF6263 family protein [Flavisolibacter sp.]|nr:DUF6263 family protein [Flavisolibacter sp.]
MKQFFLVAAVAISVTGFSQKVTNKLAFQKGQKLEMVTKVNSTVSMEMMGQSMDTKLDATITRLFDVNNVTNGTASIEHKMKRMQMSIESPMAGNQAFDSDKESDMKGDGGKVMEKAMKNKYSMTVDAGGKITAVKADDDNPNKQEKATGGDMMSGAMAGLAAGMELPKTGDISEFKILPEAGAAKGESWTDTTGGKKAKYTVTDITADAILIDYTEEGTTDRTQEAGGMEIKMSSKDKTTGKIILDKKTGLLKERNATTSSEGTMEVSGQSIPINTKLTRVTTVGGIS